jgi:hypothetical protein
MELVTLDLKLQNLGALDKEDPFTGVFFLIHSLFSNLKPRQRKHRLFRCSSGGVMAAQEVLPTARCEFDSRPELHLDFSEKNHRPWIRF